MKKSWKVVLASAAVVLGVPGGVEAAGPGSFFAVAPCRVVNTTTGSPLSSGVARSFQVAGFCGVPSNSIAVALNITVVRPTKGGFLIVWPYNTAQPGVSNINFNPNEPALANGAVIPMTAGLAPNISVVMGTAEPGSTHVILDVAGYYLP